MSYRRMQEAEAALAAEVAELLRRAEVADRDEDVRYGPDQRGDELPADARRESRLAKIREAQAALEAEARTQAQADGQPPDDARPPAQAQRNFTDPESKIQKTSEECGNDVLGTIEQDSLRWVRCWKCGWSTPTMTR
jgi:hypothetical protein